MSVPQRTDQDVPPPHRRTLPHVGINEQGMRELELWIQQIFKRLRAATVSALTGIYYNFHNVGPDDSWLYVEATDHDTTETDPPITSPFVGIEASMRFVSNNSRGFYFDHGPLLVQGGLRVDAGSGTSSPVCIIKTYDGEMTLNAGAGNYTLTAGREDHVIAAGFRVTSNGNFASTGYSIYLHDTATVGGNGINIVSANNSVNVTSGSYIGISAPDVVIGGGSAAIELVGDDIHLVPNFGGFVAMEDGGGNPVFKATQDGSVTAVLASGKTLLVKNSGGGTIFEVDENGDLHGKTGKALTFDR